MNYKHLTGDLFGVAAERDTLLVHACNAKGVWGSGIAREFKARFPTAFELYRAQCLADPRSGRGFVCHGLDEPPVGCLVTSVGYGRERDGVEQILLATRAALEEMMAVLKRDYPGYRVHSCRFNAGYFGVPWELSQAVLYDVLAQHPDVTWTVWTPLTIHGAA